ncbi:hypothetical protein J1614_010298 [Plenodomus biglobosus]|nr:hypothetical protein J1614_010298 [Plenodomus biglobosus]
MLSTRHHARLQTSGGAPTLARLQRDLMSAKTRASGQRRQTKPEAPQTFTAAMERTSHKAAGPWTAGTSPCCSLTVSIDSMADAVTAFVLWSFS